MKTMISLRKHRYVARISIFLVTLAFIGGIVGCGQYAAPVSYTLTVASTAGGSVNTPGGGNFTYNNGTVVNLVATPNNGYLFAAWTGDVGTIDNVNAATTAITVTNNYSITANFVKRYGLAAGEKHTVGLKTSGTLVAMGDISYGQCDVSGWTRILQVATGKYHTVGLKSDVTVVATGMNWDGQCDVGNWTDIIQVAAGGGHTVGLKIDGTVVAVGDNTSGQCDVGGWTNITQVAAGGLYTVGLKSNGTVVAVGSNALGQCDVGGWTAIVYVAAGSFHTVGLKSNGTVVAVGWNLYGQCEVGGWDLS
jgi:hypothetical protein